MTVDVVCSHFPSRSAYLFLTPLILVGARRGMVLGNTTNTCDNKPLHKYAAKVPIFKMNSGVVNESKLRRDQLFLVIDKAIKYPELIQRRFELFYFSDFPLPSGATQLDSITWEGPYKTLGKINPGWIANWLLARYTAAGLQKNWLAALDKQDGDAIMDLFTCELQLARTCALPAVIGDDPAMAAEAFTARADTQGRRMKHIMETCNLSAGQLDFFKGGAYTLVWGEGDIVTEISHASGAKVKMEEFVRITKAFALHDNQSDADARVECAPVVYHLHKFFVGQPFADPIKTDKRGNKALGDICKKFGDTRAAQQTASVTAQRGQDIIAEGQQARRKATTLKARSAMQQKMKQRGEKRKLDLSTKTGST